MEKDNTKMKKRNIALISHDSRKNEMIEWVKYNYNELQQHNLYCTGTTGRRVALTLFYKIYHQIAVSPWDKIYDTEKNILFWKENLKSEEFIELLPYNKENKEKGIWIIKDKDNNIHSMKIPLNPEDREFFLFDLIKPLLNIQYLLSGPIGGDSQAGTLIAEGKVDALIFFCDNLIVQGHQSDISALTRLASLYNIAFATNRTTADMILTSPLFKSEDYAYIKPDFETYIKRKI